MRHLPQETQGLRKGAQVALVEIDFCLGVDQQRSEKFQRTVELPASAESEFR